MTYPTSVSSDDLRRFSQVAIINDEAGFLLVLEQLVAERRQANLHTTYPPMSWFERRPLRHRFRTSLRRQRCNAGGGCNWPY